MKRPRRCSYLRRLLALVVLAVSLALVPSSAAGNPLDFCQDEMSPTPEAASDRAFFVSPQRAEEGSKAGVGWYHANSTAGTQWHVFITEDCMHPNRIGNRDAHAASIIWNFARLIGEIVIFVYQLAASDIAMDWIAGLVSEVMVSLREGFWRPLLPTAVIVSALWLAWVGLIKKRATLTFEGAFWMILSTAIGIWFMASPVQVMGIASWATNLTTSLLHNGLSGFVAGDDARMCPPVGVNIEFQESTDDDPPEHRGSDYIREDEEGHIGTVPATSERAVLAHSEGIFCSLIYEPWAVGVFGGGPAQSEAARLYSEQALRSQSLTATEEQAWRPEGGTFDQETYDSTMEVKRNSYRAVGEQIRHFYPESYGAWSGNDGEHRLNTAWVALLGVILGGLLIFLVSASVLVLKVMFLLLLILAPIVCLIGIHPGSGRNIMFRYGEMLLGILFKQAFLVFLMTLYLVLYRAVVAMDVAWGIKLALTVILFVAVIALRKPLARGIAAASPAGIGRIMNQVAEDKTLGRVAHAIPGYSVYRADRKAREKLKPIVGQALGTALGGPVGGNIGQQMGEKSAARMRGDHKAPPAEPPASPPPSSGAEGGTTGGQWSAQDVTPPRRDPGGPTSTRRALVAPPEEGGGGRPPSPPPLPIGPGGGGGKGGPSTPGGSGGGGGGGRTPDAAPPLRSSTLSGPAPRPAPRPSAPEEAPQMIIHRPERPTQSTPAPPPQRVTPQRIRYSRPLRSGDAPPRT